MESTQHTIYGVSDNLGVSEGDRNWAILIHLSLYTFFFLNFFAVLVPLALWFSKKAESRFIDSHGRAALNFFLTVSLISLIVLAGLSTLIFAGIIAIPALFAFDLPTGLGISTLIFVIAAVGLSLAIFFLLLILPLFGVKAASNSQTYRYPLAIPFLG